MKKALIIGGGLAGLTAASYLSKKNVNVTLIEASPKLGGRASSFYYKRENIWLDNGPHLLMGCYKYTLDFIRLIGAENELEKSENLQIPFIDRNGKVHLLSAGKRFYPFNLFKAVSGFTLLTKGERFDLISFLLKLKFAKGKRHLNISAKKYLLDNNQSDELIEKFWKLIISSVFNADSEEISAEIFIDTMKTVFLSGKESSKFYLPQNSLADLFAFPARRFIEKNGGRILLGERALKLSVQNDKITEVFTNKANYSDFDFVISALPFEKLRDILPNNLLANVDSPFTYSPILSAYLFVDENRFPHKYYGFENSEIDWIFNKKRVISVVKSNSFDFMKMSKNDIKQVIINELSSKFTFFSEKEVKSVKILKERKATLIISAENELFRRKFDAKLSNFAFIGDWTNTNLPATIESAVKSGYLVSKI